MRQRNCEVCKVDLTFATNAECSIGRSVHTTLCQSCRATMDRRIMALPQWRLYQQLLGSLEVLHELAQSGRDTRAEVHADMEAFLNLQIELHDAILAMLGRAAT